jgi:hypothetical protein
MSRRNYIDITIVILILFFDVLVYKYQGANCSNVILPRCYPTGEIFPCRVSDKRGLQADVSSRAQVQGVDPIAIGSAPY